MKVILSLTGKATFLEANGKVTLNVKIKGAEPRTHAVHLHETRDCAAPDGASAGGHWNPTHEDHGKWVTPPFHHGDIGNAGGRVGCGVVRPAKK